MVCVMAGRNPTRFDPLIERGQIAEADLDLVLAEARAQRIDPVTLFVKRHRIPKEMIGQALAASHKCQFIAFDPRFAAPTDALRRSSRCRTSDRSTPR